MVPDRQKVRTKGRTDGRTDGMDGRTDGRTDDAKTISLRLRRGIINFQYVLLSGGLPQDMHTPKIL